MQEETFGGIPDPKPTLVDWKRTAWAAAIALTLAGVSFLARYLATPQVVPWSVGGGRLQIHSRVLSDEFPLRELQLDQARILDLKRERGWQRGEKIWGVASFGFHAGRFKLQNGESVDLYLAGETTAVLIPRRGHVPVMVGVRDPQGFLIFLKLASRSNEGDLRLLAKAVAQ
jgi:hypothetical protein